MLRNGKETCGQESSLENERSYVLGIDIGGTNLRVALADMTGNIRARRRLSTEGVRDPGRIVQTIRESADALLSEAWAPRTALQAVGVGAPGVTDSDRGVVIATSYLMGWRNVPLQGLLESELGIPARVDNDVNLAALGESRSGVAQDVDDFVFLAIGTGVGAGIILNRQLHRGSAWIAGEIGYMLAPGASETPVERGKPGPLEEVLGGEGIKAQWRQRWSHNATALAQDATATEIFDHACEGNALAQEVLRGAGRALAYTIYNISLVLNCPLFVLGGSVGLHPALRDAAQAELERRKAHVQTRVEHSGLGDEAQLRGAVALAIETATAR